MTTKEKLLREIEKLDEGQLEELYAVIKQYLHDQQNKAEGTLLKLSRIQIDGPEDFAANIDLYLSGEKQIAPNPD